METKTCFECDATKPVVEFYRNKGHADGLSARCIPCTKADMHRRWRAKHPEPAPYVPPTEKLCKGCGTVKPLDEFHRHTRNRDGHQDRCKLCQTKSVLSGYKNDPQKHRDHQREWGRKNPGRKADIALKTRLGVPHGTYDKMLAAQNGMCAICDSADPGARTTRFHVDHDAETGRIRGLLCARCNTGIGQLRHSKTILLRSIKYLELTECPG